MRSLSALFFSLTLCATAFRSVAETLPGPSVSPAGATIALTARMATPRDAVLEWKDPASPAGHIVEFINRPGDEWVILGFFPPGQTSYTHPRLAPGTPYSYRVRPFFGPASTPVEVTVAAGLSDQAYAEAYARPEDYSWAPPQKLAAAGASVLRPKPIRTATAAGDGTPREFKAEVVKTTVSGFKLTWTDCSTDEEGFLIERVGAGGDFTVCALVEPDINAFGWALEPPARKGTFRVRAYYYGAPSAVASITTEPGPDDLPSTPKRAAKTARPAS